MLKLLLNSNSIITLCRKTWIGLILWMKIWSHYFHMKVTQGTFMVPLNNILLSTQRSLLKVTVIYLLPLPFDFWKKHADFNLSIPGFTFAEVGCIQTRNSEVTCCHFSSDGKVLASAGHDKKVYLFTSFHLSNSFPMALNFINLTSFKWKSNQNYTFLLYILFGNSVSAKTMETDLIMFRQV